MTITKWAAAACATVAIAVPAVAISMATESATSAMGALPFGEESAAPIIGVNPCPPDPFGRAPWQTDPRLTYNMTLQQLAEQRANVMVMVNEARAAGISDHGIEITLITAIEESKMLNIDYGDRDSIGLFQQRDFWGTREERLNPVTATRLFFSGIPGNPGLLLIDYENMESHTAAQKVQRSGTPDGSNYEKWVPSAESIMACVLADAIPGEPSDVVDAASEWLGYPYIWGGGNQYGPTTGTIPGEMRAGFDCSGLVIYAVWKASGGTLLLPHSAAIQSTYGTAVPADFAQMQPGDLIHFRLGRLGPVVDHTGIYMGNGLMVNATRPCSTCPGSVKVDDLTTGWWASQPFTVRRVTFAGDAA